MIDSVYNFLVYQVDDAMVHPGLSATWVVIVLLLMLGLLVRFFTQIHTTDSIKFTVMSLHRFPVIGQYVHRMITTAYVVTVFRILTSILFILVIATGLFGSPIAERNFATMLTWTIWWSAVVMSVFFAGSAWCAICPWDSIASWLVKRRLWRRGCELTTLSLKVPKYFRNIWPASIIFIILTWLELGVGVTASPYATALLALLVVVLTTISLSLFERKAFCHYFCPVGRTIGAYAGIAPIVLRPINQSICDECKTLECFHGTPEIESCPTFLVMGKMTQNTYCTSCGSCTQSCPTQNIHWQIRPVASEVACASRPHWDESWFIIGLLSLTLFHGVTMLPYWQGWIYRLGYLIGDSGQLLLSFSIGMVIAMSIPIVLYSVCISWLRNRVDTEWKQLFSAMAFSVLPLAFCYHIAHNLSHLLRESVGFWSVVSNPFGIDTLPLSVSDIHFRHMNPVISDNSVFAIQSLLLVFGFGLALKIVRSRILKFDTSEIKQSKSTTLALITLPITLFLTLVLLFSLWLLMQPMIMRM